MLNPAPPPDAVKSMSSFSEKTDWVQIYLLNGQRRRRLPPVGASHSVFRRVVSGRRADFDLPERIHRRTQSMLSEFPDDVRQFVGGPATTWRDLMFVAGELDQYAPPVGAPALDQQSRSQIVLLAHALRYLCDKGQSAPAPKPRRCKFCWRPAHGRSQYCAQHHPKAPEYRQRHRAYRRDRALYASYLQSVRNKRRRIAKQMGYTEVLVTEQGPLPAIDGECLVELRRYWPRLADYIGFTGEQDAMLDNILAKLGYGRTPHEASHKMLLMHPYGCQWSVLDSVETYLALWSDTASRQCVAGRQAEGLHRLSEVGKDRARQLVDSGKTQRQIAAELSVSPSTINRILRAQ